jgi:hypothetical protein
MSTNGIGSTNRPDASHAVNALTQSASSSTLQGTRRAVDQADANSWFEAMASAWGNALDSQASSITQLSDQIGQGGDQPSAMVELTAASMKMQFMANNAATSSNSVGQALETLGRKQ